MFVNFNIDEVSSFLHDFYKITGVTVSIWDADFNQLDCEPKNFSHFCTLIKSSTLGASCCLESDKQICLKAKQQRKPVSHLCHAGLLDTAVPILVKDEVLGYIMFGQIINEHNKNQINENLKNLSEKFNIDKNQLEKSLCNVQSSYRNTDFIKSAINIIQVLTRYFSSTNLIIVNESTLLKDIERFIINNISKNITIPLLCNNFHISKNKLYSLFKKYNKLTVYQYITEKRISEAKKLLISTDLTIKEISFSVGIDDYNYFIKLFKKFTNVAPLKYRKTFHEHK